MNRTEAEMKLIRINTALQTLINEMVNSRLANLETFHFDEIADLGNASTILTDTLQSMTETDEINTKEHKESGS